jgi:LAO/AO transport system kinase
MLSCAARTVVHAWGWRPRMPLHRRPRPSIRLAMARAKRVPLSEDLADLPALLVRMRAGERRAISRAVTELERLSATAPRLLRAMSTPGDGAGPRRFTRPPGAGKSTLVNAYTQHVRAGQDGRDHRRRPPARSRANHSGRSHPHDGTRRRRRLMRSLASRGHLGGCALPPCA